MKYSSHLQLQFLIRALKLDQRRLAQIMSEYYGTEHWHQHSAGNGQIVQITRQPNTAAPRRPRLPGERPAPAKKSKPVGVKTSTVSVTYRRRRTMEPH